MFLLIKLQMPTGTIVITEDEQRVPLDKVAIYDKRGGVPESAFCQDDKGLHVRKRRKGGFIAQKVLVLLSQLAP